MLLILITLNVTGLIQTLFLSFFYLKKATKNNRYKIYFASLFFIFSISISNTLCILTGNPIEFIQFVTNSTVFSIMPLLYLFIKYHLAQIKQIQITDWVHLLNILINTFFLLMITLFPDISNILKICTVLSLKIQMVTYLYKSIQMLKRTTSKESAWLKSVLVWFVVIVILNFFLLILTHAFKLIPSYISINITLVLSVLTFFIAYREMLGISKNKHDEKYSKSKLSTDKSKKYLTTAISIIENDKLFLQTDFSLRTLAEKTGLSSNILSQVINEGLNKTFIDLIHHYRIEEAKRLLIQQSTQQFTIETISGLAGYSSKSTFNSQFKKHTTLTPKEYKIQFGLRNNV